MVNTVMQVLQNKYTKWYFSIIDKRRVIPFDGYVESHHIIPTALGGSKDAANLVNLSAREHFICHLLLPKMLTGGAKHKMLGGLGWMVRTAESRADRYLPRSSYVYARARQSCITQHSPETCQKVSTSLKEYFAHNPEAKVRIAEHMRQYHTGRPKSDAQRLKIGAAHRGKPKTEQAKQLIAESVSAYVSKTIWINNGAINKRVLATEGIPTGWTRGRLMSASHLARLAASRS